MQELGIANGVVRAIDDELALARQALAPHTRLPPAPLMLQLSDMLHQQVAALSLSAGSQ
jgi:hypothetical protein